MSKVPAQWSRVARAVAVRDKMQGEAWQKANPEKKPTLIFGNGDVRSVEDVYAKVEESGADGAMIGRAIFGNPWFFHPTKRLPERTIFSNAKNAMHYSEWYAPHAGSDMHTDLEYISVPERLRVMVEHTKLFEELLPFKNFAIMKKHYKAYVHGFDGAKELRVELMEQTTSADIEKVVNTFLKTHTA
jgi:tRNA-dihydrouridine synthase